jgi:hypothetical protein
MTRVGVGVGVGARVGTGDAVGTSVGSGDAVGTVVGIGVGDCAGTGVGVASGSGVALGKGVGVATGTSVGVGLGVGMRTSCPQLHEQPATKAVAANNTIPRALRMSFLRGGPSFQRSLEQALRCRLGGEPIG